MKHLLTSLVFAVVLFPALASEATMEDLVKRHGLFYEKGSDVPFTGTVTGRAQGAFKNGKLDGPWVEYWPNGQLATKGNWKDGKPDGPWLMYHENGQLQHKGNFKDGKQDGPWEAYHEDGTKDAEYSGFYSGGVKIH